MKHALTILAALLLSSPAALQATEPAPTRFQHFITRQGDKLYDGEKEFRFIGANMPGLGLPYDYTMKLPERMTLPTPWEQADGLNTLDQMNLRVVRIWNLPIREPHDKPAQGRMTWHYVQGPGQFNEESFQVLDHLFGLANRYGIRVVFSLSDCWRYLGGVETYAAHRSRQGKRAFFTDPQVKEDFQQTIRHVLTRRNTVSGVPYKDDKAILCWELGNELWDVPYEDFAPWQREMTAFIKSLDPNHLIMDARGNVIPGEPDPNVDIFNIHYNGIYAEYLFRAKGTTNDWLSYNVAASIESVKVVAFCAKDLADLTVQVSADGRTFTAVQPQRSVRRLGSPMTGPAAGQSRTLVEYECAVPTGNRYLKLLWTGPAELDRVEIYYK